MKSVKFIIGGTIFVLLIAFGFRNSGNKLPKNDSLASLFSMPTAEAEGGFFDTWLWVEQMTTTDCTYTVTTSVRIEDPNHPGTFIYSSETSTMNGHWQNCPDGPEFCSSGCRG